VWERFWGSGLPQATRIRSFSAGIRSTHSRSFLPNPSKRSNWRLDGWEVRKVHFLHSRSVGSDESKDRLKTMQEPLRESKGSAFALMYILFRRSCKPISAFVIRRLPSFLSESLTTARPLRSTEVTPLQRYYQPLRHLSPSADFPVSPVIRPLLLHALRRGAKRGFSSCIVHPCRRAVATAPPVCPAASVRLQRDMLPSPVTRSLGHWSSTSRGDLCLVRVELFRTVETRDWNHEVVSIAPSYAPNLGHLIGCRR
jgi:hypothetical protein